MPVPPASLPRLVAERPPVLNHQDVDVLLKLARAEVAAGLQAGKQAREALGVLEVIARVETWHHYEAAHRETRYGATPTPDPSQEPRRSPGAGPEGPGVGGSAADPEGGPERSSGDLFNLPEVGPG